MNSGLQASRYYSMKDRVDALPYWQYETMEDGRVRPAHAELNNRVFHHDDKIWNTIYPPNGWRCRCSVRPTDDGRNVLEKNAYDPDAFLGKAEVAKMKGAGFAVNRARLGEAFKLNTSYNTAGEKAILGVTENYGDQAGRQSYTAINSRDLPDIAPPAATREQAESQLFPNPKQDKAVFFDHTGRPWTLPRSSYTRHTDPKDPKYGKENRFKFAHAIPDVLKEPDEVWLLGTVKKNAPGQSKYKFIRYYQGKTIVVEAEAVLQARSEPSMRIITWYEANSTTIGTHRRGYLQKRNAR